MKNKDWLEQYKTNPKRDNSLYKNYYNPQQHVDLVAMQNEMEKSGGSKGLTQGLEQGQQAALQDWKAQFSHLGQNPANIFSELKNLYGQGNRKREEAIQLGRKPVNVNPNVLNTRKDEYDRYIADAQRSYQPQLDAQQQELEELNLHANNFINVRAKMDRERASKYNTRLNEKQKELEDKYFKNQLITTQKQQALNGHLQTWQNQFSYKGGPYPFESEYMDEPGYREALNFVNQLKNTTNR